jgi:hypothetical protein
MSGLAGNAGLGLGCRSSSIPRPEGLRRWSVLRGRCRRGAPPPVLAAVGCRSYSHVCGKTRGSSGLPASRDVSDTRTSPKPGDRPTLVRSMSEIALIASVQHGPTAPDLQPVPVTQLDGYRHRAESRLPHARRPINAAATDWNVRVGNADFTLMPRVDSPGDAGQILRNQCQNSMKGLV